MWFDIVAPECSTVSSPRSVLHELGSAFLVLVDVRFHLFDDVFTGDKSTSLTDTVFILYLLHNSAEELINFIEYIVKCNYGSTHALMIGT